MNIMIIGGRERAKFLVKSFISKGHTVTVINEDYELCEKLSRKYKANFVYGDGTKPHVLEDAGIVYSDILIALTPKDQDNLVVCQLAKKVYGVNKTFATVNDPKNIELFKKFGIDTVISTTSIISSIIEQRIFIDDISNLVPIEEGKVALMELEIHQDYPIVGKKLKDINLPDQSIIGCIIRKGDAVIPKGDSAMLVGDKLIVFSLPDVQSEVIKIITGKIE